MNENERKKIGALWNKMSSLQQKSVSLHIGDGFPSVVAVHDCGLARVVVSGQTVHFDEYGKMIAESVAAERKRLHEANRPKRGRPRKS